MTAAQAQGLIRKVFGGVTDVSFAIRLWDGTEQVIGNHPACTIVFRDEKTFGELLTRRDSYRFAMAYVQNRVDVEGDVFAALRLKDTFQNVTPSVLTRLSAAWLLGKNAWHSRIADKANVQAHYDVGNEFYRLFLDTKHLAYSCAYFHTLQESLEDAQTHKLDLICRKLRLKEGERLLDIGCGWGGLLIHAATQYGITGYGITLSKNQLELAQQRVKEAGLENKIRIELRDYRDLGDASFEKIASVGMVEHVGIAKYPGYFAAAYRALTPGGLFLNHGITAHRRGPPFSGDAKFMFTHIFPNAELDNISHMETVAEDAGLEILNVESLRPHYAKTLTEWYRRLHANEAAAVVLVGSEKVRAWKLYLAGCALAFETAQVSIYQTLLAKPNGGFTPIPLTMKDVYRV